MTEGSELVAAHLCQELEDLPPLMPRHRKIPPDLLNRAVVVGLTAVGGHWKIPYQFSLQMPILALEWKTWVGRKIHQGVMMLERAHHPVNPGIQSSQTTPPPRQSTYHGR
eukprot:3710482-Ditylum_brightwellii.AAC.2